MSRFIVLFFSILLFHSAFSQSIKTVNERPKLIIGIVVDQMRYDYLFRYQNKWGDDGFKRLLKNGFLCRNTHYNYVPTYTGPGHAAIYTGTTPSINGIVANDWFNRKLNDTVYCTEDKSVKTVGEGADRTGKMSPKNLLTTTITDELKFATNQKSKVIGIALKDRGAIIPAGHAANAAYWFDGTTGNWISSSYYMKEMPQWISQFNDRRLADTYMGQTWNTLLPINEYSESTADDMPYENPLLPGVKPVFPYDFSKFKGKGYDYLRSSPFGNTLTKEMAIETIKNENLGKNGQTDFLSVSFSSTDYVGHLYGPNSIEVEDIYLRLDKDIAALLKFVDSWIDKKDVLIFLTSDHGVSPVPEYWTNQMKVPSGVYDASKVLDSLKTFLNNTFGPNKWISSYLNQQVYLNRNLIYNTKGVYLKEVQERTAGFLRQFNGVADVITEFDLQEYEYNKGINNKIENGFYPNRSGDVVVTFQPGWFEGRKLGTTHGEPYPYDTHVPLIFYGWKIPEGSSSVNVDIIDIAPTIADFIGIESPNGCTGKPIDFILK